MTALGEYKRERIDELAARAGQLPAGEGGLSLTRSAFRRLRRDPVAITGAVIVLVFLFVAAFAPWLAPKDPVTQYLLSDIRPGLIPGSQEGFPLGVDNLGRDLLSRLIYGSRQSLLIGVVSTVLGLIVGMSLGVLAGAFGGWIDTVVMRFVDIILSIPGLLMAITISVLLGQNQYALMIAIAVVQVPVFARLLRGSMLAQRGSDYAVAAQALGVKKARIVFGHVLPNSLSPVIVQATLSLATAIIEAAALSYLGLGDPDIARPEWGAMLANAQDFLSIRPALAVWPAMCIIVVALGFTLLGERLREALDPKFRR
ncbi:ABC transporter permease [Blastococcus saxobsidens]|uniref:Dipeptide transport system permease protein dppC (ABC transporter) n=1 Tax=Blastococcus saxobsidens (strain DD2) TaxID=1146883 RepID=H6RNY2_BLASD|nr:ABC transporter permease [Blastococcus saxobsidens]CCG01444.1 Dipeptide transport system permease protein dppC (ABC transporter) [Blastococcus saxobsidens DD2]